MILNGGVKYEHWRERKERRETGRKEGKKSRKEGGREGGHLGRRMGGGEEKDREAEIVKEMN